MPLTALRDNFRSNFPAGLDEPIAGLTGEEPIADDGAVEEASAESFPASDAPSFASGEAVDAPAAAGGAGRRRPAGRRARLPAGRHRDRRRARDDPDRLGGDRRDHLVHQHVQPDRDDRRRAARPERDRPRACASARRSRPRWRRAPRPSPATSRRPGSWRPLETLGFALAGYGCTTCIGNSGPLDEAVAAAVEANDLVVAAVLSGNRNFEGRIHPLARASYLASPPLVVAFALAGRVDIDLTSEPLGTGSRRVAGLPRRHLAVARRDPGGDRRRDRSGALPADLRDGVRGRRALARPADPGRRSLRLGRRLDATSPSRRSSTG